MQYYSTNKKSPLVSFKHALIEGQAPDRGLYMPKTIPQVSLNEIEEFRKLNYSEIAVRVTSLFIQDEVPINDLRNIAEDAYNYEVPLIDLGENQYILRLDQGPTYAFKDFAARMMSRLMQYFITKENKRMVILVATSGDTGGAIADAFYNLDNIDVIILYPKKEISARQRKQMTTLGKNITAIALDGKFDDCQAFVKEAFADPDLSNISLSSANSINFGRIMPQIVYYIYALSRLPSNSQVIFSVPSGNFGDLMGGVIAKHMGFPIERFIVAVNENDEFPSFLETGIYNKVEPSRACISNAMNVGHPSNLARLIDMYDGQLDEKGTIIKLPDMNLFRKDFWSISVSDSQTRETIKKMYETKNYILEPHGAVSWYGLIKYLESNPTNFPLISFETAHPAKFPEEIQKILNIEINMTENMKIQSTKEEFIHEMDKNYSNFKNFLRNKYSPLFTEN